MNHNVLMGFTKVQRRILALILFAYVLLGVVYALATPPLEASDEYKHYPVVQFVQTKRALPVLDPASPGRWLQEAVQPPFYYVLMAGLTSWINTEDLPEVHQVNPHAFVGNPNQIRNKNLIFHRPEQESFPWQGTVLAVYVARLATIAFGIGTVLLTARLGVLLFSAQVGLLSAALTAFNPMFIFVSAAVNNDALAILLGQLGLFLLVLLWRDAPDPRRHWLRYAALGLVLGLGISTKLSLGGLLGVAGIALLALSWIRRQPRYLLLGGTIVLLVALVVCLPWLARNMILYGGPTALETFIAVQGSRSSPITWSDWVREFGTLYRSFWGLFGGVNVAAPELFYSAYNLLAIVGAAGFLYWAWQQWKSGRAAPQSSTSSSPHNGIWLLVLWPAFLLALLIRWNVFAPSFQGRLLFPALGALNVLWAVGLLNWVVPARRNQMAAGLAVAAFVAALLLPWLSIRPAYAYPEPLLTVPEGSQFGPITFEAGEGEIQLVGVEMPPGQSLAPGGGPAEVTLYWKLKRPVNEDYLSTVHLLGRKNRSIAQVNRSPAWGMIPTSRWQPGQIWRDDYQLYVNGDPMAPARLKVKVGLYDSDAGQDLLANGPDGQPIELLLVGEARLAAQQNDNVEPSVSLEVDLADGIRFLGFDVEPVRPQPGESLSLDLYWLSTGEASLDYTVFVHLIDSQGNQIAVADGPPVSGDYPTSWWRSGDEIIDRHILALPDTLPPGAYQIAVGLYDPVTFERVARLDGDGDSVLLPIEIWGQD